MSVARRPLLTAVAAGALLCALWFVPSTDTAGDQGRTDATQASVADMTGGQDAGKPTRTGGVDTSPYLLGGTVLLGVGAGSVTLAMRRGGRAA